MTEAHNVLIATPCYGGQLTVSLFRSLLGISDLCREQDIDLDFLVVDGEAAITRGRSNLAARFLTTHYQTLAFIDADILIEPSDFLKLLCLDGPVRGAAVNLKTADHSEALNVYWHGTRIKRAEMPTRPFEVEYIGAAVMLIERRVIEVLSEAQGIQYYDGVVGRAAHIFGEQIFNDALLSEDYSFCRRARSHGFSVWCDPSVIVSHYGPSSWRH